MTLRCGAIWASRWRAMPARSGRCACASTRAPASAWRPGRCAGSQTMRSMVSRRRARTAPSANRRRSTPMASWLSTTSSRSRPTSTGPWRRFSRRDWTCVASARSRRPGARRGRRSSASARRSSSASSCRIHPTSIDRAKRACGGSRSGPGTWTRRRRTWASGSANRVRRFRRVGRSRRCAARRARRCRSRS
jgi:hypothetical protein